MDEIRLVDLTKGDLEKMVADGMHEGLADEQMNDDKGENRLMTRKETAEYLSVSQSTLWTWAKQGKINPFGIAGRVYFYRDEINKCLMKLNPPT
ncbi:MAG: helix-turn-helix domain-containing protein [Bacteroidota bacterium]